MGRGEVPDGEAILLCVPDAEIRAAAGVVAGAARFVGHTSGATAYLWSSGGGVSVFWPKPSWQVGLGVPPPIPALPLSIIVICPIYHSLFRFTVGTLSDMLVILNLLGERRPPVPPLLGSWQ